MKKTEDRPYLELGQRIADLRKGQGLSQENLAEDAGVAISALKNIERGVAEGYIQTRRALATVLKCSIADFYSSEPRESTTARPSPRDLKALIETPAAELPHALLAPLNAEFLSAPPEIRALMLAILYDDKSITAPYLGKGAKVQKAR